MFNMRSCARMTADDRAESHGFAWAARMLMAVVLLLAIAIAASSPMPAYAETGTSTRAAVLKIAEQYDKDAYHILKTQVKRGDDILKWLESDPWFVSAFEVMVHEECHGYMFRKYRVLSCYVGGKKRVDVKIGKVYRTKKMARSIPKKLRSERYATYVSKPIKNLASNVHGIYGLLNEYTAYCWGTTALVNLYQFCKEVEGENADMWSTYLGNAYDSALARAEFRYFMEHYLVYAKKHYPKVYSDVMRNKRFRKALKMVDRKYAKTAKTLDSRLVAITSSIRAAGFMVYREGDFLYVSDGAYSAGNGLSFDEYNRLAKALAGKKYKAIEKKLGLTPVTVKAPKLMSREQAEADWARSHADADLETGQLQAVDMG